MIRDSHNYSEYKKIVIIENEIEAQFIASVLNERGIPHEIYSFQDTAFDGLFQTQKGWGKVMAPKSFEAEILEIINDVRRAPPLHEVPGHENE